MNARTLIVTSLFLGPLTALAEQGPESFGLEKLLEKVPAVADQIRPQDGALSTPSLLEYRASRASKIPDPQVPPAKAAEEKAVDWKQMREAAFQAMGLGENRKPDRKTVSVAPAEDPLKIPLIVSYSARDRLVASALVASRAESRSLSVAPQLSSLAKKGFVYSRSNTQAPARAHKTARSNHSTSPSVGYATAQE